jgi:hypothetical protein
MLILSRKPVEAVTWTLQPGVTITQKPLDTIGYEAAQAEAGQHALQLRNGAAVLEDAGLDGGDWLKDGVLRAGLSQYLLAIELGTLSIQSWTGIGDETERPLEPSRNAIATLCRDPAAAEQITRHALGRIFHWRAEGNASAASPSGGGEVAEPIAGTVERAASPAPAGNVV